MHCPPKEQNGEDPFVECHSLRQRLVEVFPSGQWGDHLRRYGESVDRRDGVNNFSAATLALISGQETDRGEWHTSLFKLNAEQWLADLGIESCAREEFSGARIHAMIPEREAAALSRAQVQLENVVPKRVVQEKPRDMARLPVRPPAACRPAEVKTEATESKSLFFTARDELRKQQQQRGVPVPNEPARKCLGPRRHGGFVPPFVKDVAVSDGGQLAKRSRGSEPTTEEPEDERLANLDPKMVELIRAEIMTHCTGKITWDDVAGLEYAKESIQEMVVWPMLRPDLFTGLRCPPRGLLLFGPPGTGKTLLGRCIAAHAQATFFCVSAATLTSKWVGDGEKMVRVLFAVARCHQPAVVFIDEIDSILTQRSDTEHESSRRLKTEFLVQLDGAGVSGAERVLVVGATNRPQELDEAARRRLVKRLYIPLPDEPARRQLVARLLSGEKHCLTDTDLDSVAAQTHGFSGADLRAACAEAALGPVRELGANMRLASPDQVRPVSSLDFKIALTRVKPSVAPGDLDAYLAWDKTFGCGS